MWKRIRQAPKRRKWRHLWMNAWAHKMWHKDSEALIFSIRFVFHKFMWHLEKENISDLSLHIVSEWGQLPDWGGAQGRRQALCRWHPVHSCHLPLDSTSAVPPCFPGLVWSTRLLACFSPWALCSAHPAQHPHVIRLAGAVPPFLTSFSIGKIPYEWTLGSSLLRPLLILFQREYASSWLPALDILCAEAECIHAFPCNVITNKYYFESLKFIYTVFFCNPPT